MQKHTSAKILALATILSTLFLAGSASADTITLVWDSNPEPEVVGYVVHVGTQPGTSNQHFDVGPSTSWPFTAAVSGQQYCFTVTAYYTGPIEGPPSNEVCGYSDAAPTLTNPGTQTSTTGQPATLQLVGSDPSGNPVTYSATGLPPSLSLMASTGFISGTPTTVGTYTVTATVSNGTLSSSQTFTWTVSAPDGLAPAVTITGPTSAATYTTTAVMLALAGTASDNVGVTTVTWVSNRGSNGAASGTTAWNASVPLQSGTNVLTVTARDAAGNTASDVLTVTLNVAPVLTSIPNQSMTVGLATTLQLTATDDNGDALVYSATGLPTGVSVNAGTGLISGTPSAAGSYSVTASVSDGTLSASRTFTWTVTPGSDAAAPAVTITTPTSATTYTTTTASVALGGTASDNVGVTQVSWATDRGASGTATGTSSWSATLTLQAGVNVVTVTARDAAGNVSTDVLTITCNIPDATAPVVAITTPTTGTSFSTTSASITLGGTASDNIGVTRVRWMNNRGGSGNAVDTTNWSVTIPLQSGSNFLSVTAFDAAGNMTSDVLSVTYTADSTAPVVAITGPTSSATFTTTTASLTLAGTASDSIGVTQVSWVNDRGGSGTATGTTSWSAPLTLQAGVNVLTVTARDAAGNTSADVLTVTYNQPDTTVPGVSITSPTTAPTFNTSATTIALAGTASDNVGVASVSWANSRGGSGTATGTTSWSATVALLSGANVVTVTARDAAGNTATATLTVTVNSAPTLASVANQTTAQANAASLQLSGSDPDGDVLTYGASGLPPGVAIAVSTGLISGTPTTPGTYAVTVTVADAAQTATRTFTWAVTPETVAPVVTITGPTTATTFTASAATLTLSGTASDNVGVTLVSWVNDRGGSGTATGTTTWSNSVTLQAGVNVLTVTARDAAGNVATDTLTVTYSAQLGVTLAADRPAPQGAGTSITFTATGTGGSAPYQYRWWYFDGARWTILRPWNASSTYTWTPATPNSAYQIRVEVRGTGPETMQATMSFPIN